MDSRRAFMKGELDIKIQAPETAIPHRSLEERRALLSVFYLTSMKSTMDYSRLETLQVTPYLDDCCHVLTQQREHLNDLVLVNLVRIQRIVESIAQIFPYDDNRPARSISMPMSMTINALSAELDNLRRSWTAEIQRNHVLLLNFHAAEVRLYEIAMWDRTTVEIGSGTERLRQLEVLNKCLLAVRAYFDIYTTIPAHYYALLPFIILTQSGLMILIACKLCLLKYPGWDAPHAREVLNILPVFDREVECFEYVAKERSNGMPDFERSDIFSTFAQRMRKVKATYQSRVAADSGAPLEHPQGVVQNDFLMQDPFNGFDPSFWLMANDDWWMQGT